MSEFCNVNNVKFELFAKHICDDKSKRHVISLSSGKKSFVADENHQFIAKNIARGDRGNDGMNAG